MRSEEGVEAVRIRDPDKARALKVWLQAIVQAFGPRILGVDAAVVESWGRISAIRSVPVVDALLAATTSVHDLVLVTRNAADVAGLGLNVLNPFEPSGARAEIQALDDMVPNTSPVIVILMRDAEPLFRQAADTHPLITLQSFSRRTVMVR